VNYRFREEKTVDALVEWAATSDVFIGEDLLGFN
jgi:hypothetical protein